MSDDQPVEMMRTCNPCSIIRLEDARCWQVLVVRLRHEMILDLLTTQRLGGAQGGALQIEQFHKRQVVADCRGYIIIYIV